MTTPDSSQPGQRTLPCVGVGNFGCFSVSWSEATDLPGYRPLQPAVAAGRCCDTLCRAGLPWWRLCPAASRAHAAEARHACEGALRHVGSEAVRRAPGGGAQQARAEQRRGGGQAGRDQLPHGGVHGRVRAQAAGLAAQLAKQVEGACHAARRTGLCRVWAVFRPPWLDPDYGVEGCDPCTVVSGPAASQACRQQ